MNYLVTFKGNDGFELSEQVVGESLTLALQNANDIIPIVQRLTIEQVRVAGIVEMAEGEVLDRSIPVRRFTRA